MPPLFLLLSCVAGDEPCESSLGDADANCDGIDDSDVDGDGAISAALGGEDCDDADPLLNPNDGDEDGWSTCTGDCDDADPTRGARGEALEICDDIDNDCNGVIDIDDLGASACERTDLFEQPTRVLLDLMLVLDDSGSMADELEALGLAGPSLLGPLAGTDTHVGIVSNDIDTDGRMHGSGGEPWLDLTTVTESQAFAWFSSATALTTEGSHLARGLDVAIDAIDKSGDTWNVGFRRADAPLVILFVADRDDESQIDQDAFLLWLANTVAASGEAGRVHSVVPPNTSEICAGTTGPALVYTSLAADTGGRVVSICADDYGPDLALIGAAEEPAHDVVLPLTLTPIPATLSVDILTTDGVSDVLQAEAVTYEPFTNTVTVDEYAWSELDRATVHYLVLPEQLAASR